MLFATIVVSIWQMRSKRSGVAWKLVLRTPVVFLPMLLIHGLLPIFPWWGLDAAGIVALVALCAYTERFPWRAPVGPPCPVRGGATAPAVASVKPVGPPAGP